MQLAASVESCREYLDLAKKYPKFVTPGGSAENGEIELILDEERMLAIEKETGRTVGVMGRDKYFLWVNDACKFPGGKEGVYGRLIWMSGLDSEAAVIVMPVFPDGKIAVNCNFRHATRSWEIELPAGLIDDGESPEDAAVRETKEETGLLVDRLVRLGEIPSDSGAVSAVLPVFLARVTGKGNAMLEDSEAIAEVLALSVSEIKEAFGRGFLEVKIKGIDHKVPFRDSGLAYAILMGELKKEL